MNKKTANGRKSYKPKLFSFEYLLYDLVKWWGWWQCLLWYRLNIKYDGKEAKQKIKGGAIISSNHVGFSDPFILQCAFLYRRFHFLYMKELTKNKFQEWAYRRVFLSFPIDRDKPSYSTLRFLGDYVKDGNLLAMFPEGHIKRDDQVDAFKGGVVLISYLSGRPIIPVYHERRKNIWHMTRLVVGKPFDVKAKIGPVLSQEKLQEVAQELYNYELHLKEMCESRKK